MLNFNHVYYFHVAATEGSVKGAADRLDVTQPTVSEQIKLLEKALDTTLFERTSTGLRLTESGRVAYEHTTAMFRAGERLVRALGRAADPPATLLRVGVSASIARSIAADFLMPLLRVPDCRPVIRTGDGLELLRDLRGHELDLVIADTEPVDATQRGLETVTLHRPTLIAIAAIDVDPAPDWSNLAVLEHKHASSFRWEVEGYLQENALTPRAVAELDDAFLMLEAVARGSFVAFVPKSVARDALALRRVKVIAELEAGNASVVAILHRREGADLARNAVQLMKSHAGSHFA